VVIFSGVDVKVCIGIRLRKREFRDDRRNGFDKLAAAPPAAPNVIVPSLTDFLSSWLRRLFSPASACSPS